MLLWNVGFTGTQELITEGQYGSLWWLLNELDPACCHHGDCIGADSYFHLLVAHLDRNLCIHPPDNPAKRAFCNTGHRVMMPEKPYLERNKGIVDDVVELLDQRNDPELGRQFATPVDRRSTSTSSSPMARLDTSLARDGGTHDRGSG